MGTPGPPSLVNQELPMLIGNVALCLGGFLLFSMVIIFIYRPYINTFELIHFFPLTQMNEILMSKSPVNFEISDTKTKMFILVQWTFFIAHWLFLRVAYMLIKKTLNADVLCKWKESKLTLFSEYYNAHLRTSVHL